MILRGKGLGPVNDEWTAINRWPLLQRFGQVADGTLSLNEMICHHDVYRILGPAFWHMTGAAVGGTKIGMILRRDRHMARHALPAIPRDRIGPTRYVVRIVARRACHTACATSEAGRLTQPVRLIDDLELVIVSCAFRMIEMHNVRAERRSGAIGKRLPIESTNRLWQFGARSLQVALHTDIHLKVGAEPLWIHNRLADLRCIRVRCAGPPDMFGSRSVTALAIDPLREFTRCLRISVMTKKATVIDESREVLWGSAVVPRAHVPGLLLRIPTERKLNHLPRRRLMHVRTCMIAGSDDVRGLEFEGVRLVSFSIEFIAPLEHASIPLDDFIMASRCLVNERSFPHLRPRSKRTSHTDLLVGIENLCVAGAALPGVDVRVRGRCSAGRPLRPKIPAQCKHHCRSTTRSRQHASRSTPSC